MWALLALLLLLIGNIESSHGSFNVAADNSATPASETSLRANNNRNVGSNVLTTTHQPFRSSEHDEYRRVLTEFIWQQRGQTILPTPIQEGLRIGLALDFSADGSRLAFSSRGTRDEPGWVRVVQFDAPTQTWNALGQDLVGANPDDRFGESVAISADGTTLAVGAPQSFFPDFPRPPGFVRLYRYDSSASTWNQIGQDIFGEASEDNSGAAVLLSSNGDTVAIRAPRNQGGSILLNTPGGQVRVYSLSGSTWVQLGGDIDGDVRFAGNTNTIAMSANGRILAVGGQNRALSISIVRLFEYNAGSSAWIPRGQDLDNPGFTLSDNSVALSADGNVVAIRNTSNSREGSVSVFRYDESTPTPRWNPQGNTVQGEENVFFGVSVDLSSDGTRLAVTARGSFANRTPARVQVFQLTGGMWLLISQDITLIDGSRQTVRLSSDGTMIAVGDFNFEETGAVRVFSETDQTPRPTLSPQPTMAPTMRPTFQPPARDPFFCFSGDSVVQVQGLEVPTRMRDLSIGDRILVGNNEYEPVYSFGHKLPSVYHTDFHQLTVVRSDGTAHQLTITPDHMVFVGEKGRTIPASLIEVGDQVQIVDESGSDTFGDVTKIQRTASSGLYAPFTPSGMLVVNGVRVSAFTSVQGSEMVHVLGSPTPISHHWLGRTLKLPHRIWCYDLALCDDERYIDGMSSWMQFPHKLYVWWTRQSFVVQTVVTIPFVLWLLLLGFAEVVFIHGAPFMSWLLVLVGVAAALLWWPRTRSRDLSYAK